jgi:streptogramin lyase
LFRRDPAGGGRGKFRRYLDHFGDTWFQSIVQDREGYIWATDWERGLYRLNPKTGDHVNYRHDPANPESIGGNAAQGAWLDADGNIWVGAAATGKTLTTPRFFSTASIPPGKLLPILLKKKKPVPPRASPKTGKATSGSLTR